MDFCNTHVIDGLHLGFLDRYLYLSGVLISLEVVVPGIQPKVLFNELCSNDLNFLGHADCQVKSVNQLAQSSF